jgi:pyrimidine operon attenuation protein/uracil phosphoribosyltransferase
MSMLSLDAEVLYGSLRSQLHAWMPKFQQQPVSLVGVWSGGAWLAQRLHQDLALSGEYGVISSALHRDDFDERGMMAKRDVTRLPFEVDGRHIVLVDDVLHTGRTIRAVINELFDFGRPASVMLAVLVDRFGRELPIEAACAASKLTLPDNQRLSLKKNDDGHFSFQITQIAAAGEQPV